MKTLQVAEVRSHFSALLKEVAQGQEVGVAYGRKKQVIAVIVPYEQYQKTHKRRLGTLKGKASVSFSDSWTMTDEELLGS
jgi:antitoxin (DNA-binding transcriptional repressor) of toxin-antitoxin stability system